MFRLTTYCNLLVHIIDILVSSNPQKKKKKNKIGCKVYFLSYSSTNLKKDNMLAMHDAKASNSVQMRTYTISDGGGTVSFLVVPHGRGRQPAHNIRDNMYNANN